MSDVHFEAVLHSASEEPECPVVGCPDDLCQGPGPTLCGNRPPARWVTCIGCPHCFCDGDDDGACYVCGDCDDFFDGNPL